MNHQRNRGSRSGTGGHFQGGQDRNDHGGHRSNNRQNQNQYRQSSSTNNPNFSSYNSSSVNSSDLIQQPNSANIHDQTQLLGNVNGSSANPQAFPYAHSQKLYATNNYQGEEMNLVPRQSVYDSYTSPGVGLAGTAPQGSALLNRQPSVPESASGSSRRPGSALPPQVFQNYLQSNLHQLQSAAYQQQMHQGSSSKPAQQTKLQEPNSGSSLPANMVSKMSPDDLLKNFRSLECAGCQRHFGYQSRTKKELVFCAASCMDEHAGCLPTILEKNDAKPQQSAPLLPNPPLIPTLPTSVMPNAMSVSEQRKPQIMGVSPAQAGGYGSTSFQQENFRGSFMSSMSPPSDFQNGPRDQGPRNHSRDQGQIRGGSGDNGHVQRPNNSARHIDGDRRTGAGNYSNGTSMGYGNRDQNISKSTGYGSREQNNAASTGYGSRERGTGNRGGNSGGGSDRDRRGGPRKIGDKTPFGVGDDDKEWGDTDVVDRKAEDTSLSSAHKTVPPIVKAQPAKIQDPPPTDMVLEAARNTLASVAIRENAVNSGKVIKAVVDAATPALSADPVVQKQVMKTQQPTVMPPFPIEKKEIIKVAPESLLSGLTDALDWSPLEVGIPTTLARTFVNDVGDFFVQGFHIHKEAQSVAKQIEAFLSDGKTTMLRKCEPKTLCLAPFSGDFYRGEILGPTAGQKDHVDIFFSDFGNIESVGADLAFELPSSLSSVPRLISHCLWDAVLTKHIPEAKMKEIFEDERLKVLPTIEIAPGQYLVQLGHYAASATFEIVSTLRPEKPKSAVQQVETEVEPTPPTVVKGPKPSPPVAPVPEPKINETVEPASPAAPIPANTQQALQTKQESPVSTPVQLKGVETPTSTPVAPSARFSGSRPSVTRASDKTPVPASESVSIVRKKYMLKDLPYSDKIKANLEVFVAFTWNTMRYLVVGLDHELKGTLVQALIAEQYQSCEKLKIGEVPVVGEVLLGPYEGEYYRGVVRKVDLIAKTASLEFIDYGDKADSKFENLFIPSDKMMDIPIQGLNVIVPKLAPVEGMDEKGSPSDFTSEPMLIDFLDSTERIVEDLEVVLWIKDNLTFNAVVHKNT